MFKILLEFERTNMITLPHLLLDVEHHEDSKRAWEVLKTTMNTDRSIEFLQSRYRRLISNQKLNTKEMALLNDQFDKKSIEEFMIIFPGKSSDTLSMLISKLQKKHEEKVNK